MMIRFHPFSEHAVLAICDAHVTRHLSDILPLSRIAPPGPEAGFMLRELLYLSGGMGGEGDGPNMMALSPMTVPDYFPNVPMLAVSRNPVFPKFIKMIEISNPALCNLLRRKVSELMVDWKRSQRCLSSFRASFCNILLALVIQVVCLISWACPHTKSYNPGASWPSIRRCLHEEVLTD